MSDTTLTSGPERYVRINIAQNSKGFTYETTVSLRWTSDDFTAPEHAAMVLEELLAESRCLAQDEIKAREAAHAI